MSSEASVYIRSNLNGPLVLPLVGRTADKVGRIIKLLPARDAADPKLRDQWNKTTPEVLRIISGGVNEKGKARGGSAATYFNNRHLQTGTPLEGDRINEIKQATGLRKSPRAEKNRKSSERLENLEAKLEAQNGLLARTLAKLAGVEPEDEILLDPSTMNLIELESAINGLDGAELAGVLALECKRAGGARKGAVELITDAIRAV